MSLEIAICERVSFPAKFAGTCRGCGERIAVGAMIVWKAEKGAWHEACEPNAGPIDTSGIERFLQAKVALFIAMGGILPQHTDDGVTATAKAVYEANASMGHYWSKDRGFYGKGFTEPA